MVGKTIKWRKIMAKKPNAGQQKHDGLVLILRDVLTNAGDYDELKLFWDYCRNGQRGEVDLLAISHHLGFRETPSYDFYEVKSTYRQRTRNVAQRQFDRFKLAFPEHYRNGFIFTTKGLLKL